MTRSRRSRLALGSCVALAAALLLATPSHAADLERQPYLQSATPSSIVVVWTTLANSTGAVHYGTSPDALDQQVPSPTVGSQHEVPLTGLSPSTRYYYQVLGDGLPLVGGDELHSFETPPAVGSPVKLRAWIVGDSGTGGSGQAQVRDAMLDFVGSYEPDIYLHLGDMAYDTGTYQEFSDNFYAPYQDILRRIPVWPTLGNHEGANSDSGTQTGPYYGGYVLPTMGQAGGLASGTEAYYAFDYGNVHFVVLDSHDSPRTPGGAMLTWLSNDLASTDQEWIIAFWHHPPYTKGSHDSDTEGQLVDMRENALPILEAGGVDLVLAGHSHIYERSYLLDGAYATPSVAGDGVLDGNDGRPLGDGPYAKPPGLSSHEGAVYVVAGHGGTGTSQDGTHPLMVFTEPVNGSCLLDVQGNRLSLLNLRADGQVTDRVAIVKGEGLVLASPDGGEVLTAGQPYEVRWATVGTIDDVGLSYSVDDGATWTTIETSVPNTGSYAWNVPVVDTEQALVRVSDATDDAIFDESNAGFSISSEVPVVVIDFGHTWRYHDQGEDLGAGWTAADYDDASWPEGPGQLGYGDGDEATVLLDADPNYPSAYFRTTFEAPEEGEIVAAELVALYDDGVAVWINDQLVAGANVDDGTDYGTWASAQSEDNTVSSSSIDPSVLVAGTNVVAAMVKQVDEGSSDLSFDLRLVVTVHIEPPPGGSEGDTGADETAGGSGAEDTAGATTGVGTSGGIDGSSSTAGATGEGGGCACRSGGPRSSTVWWGLCGLMGLHVRRRRGGRIRGRRRLARHG